MTALLAVFILAVHAQDPRPKLPPGDPVKYREALDKLPNSMLQLNARTTSQWRQIIEEIVEQSVTFR